VFYHQVLLAVFVNIVLNHPTVSVHTLFYHSTLAIFVHNVFCHPILGVFVNTLFCHPNLAIFNDHVLTLFCDLALTAYYELVDFVLPYISNKGCDYLTFGLIDFSTITIND